MVILTLVQEEKDVQWAAFDSVEQGRAFLRLLPGYRAEADEDGEIDREWVDVSQFPDYDEIVFGGVRMPITRFMFAEWVETEVYFSELPHLGSGRKGLAEGCTTVDAYSVPNDELRQYIVARERNFQHLKIALEAKGMEVARGGRGSEDGEYILYRQRGEAEWHFLCHLDPQFVAHGFDLHDL